MLSRPVSPPPNPNLATRRSLSPSCLSNLSSFANQGISNPSLAGCSASRDVLLRLVTNTSSSSRENCARHDATKVELREIRHSSTSPLIFIEIERDRPRFRESRLDQFQKYLVVIASLFLSSRPLESSPPKSHFVCSLMPPSRSFGKLRTLPSRSFLSLLFSFLCFFSPTCFEFLVDDETNSLVTSYPSLPLREREYLERGYFRHWEIGKFGQFCRDSEFVFAEVELSRRW